MDSKLKQRLLGAAVLVALAVIIVPELIRQPEDYSHPAGPPVPAAPQPGDDWVLSLPTPEILDEVVTLDDPTEFAPAPEFSSSDPDTDPAPTTATGPAAPDTPAAGASAAPSEPVAAPAPAPVQPRAASPMPQPAPRAPTPLPPAAQPADPAPPPIPPIDLVTRPGRDGPASTAAATGAGNGWLVQVGSFALEQNANNLRERLRANRFQAVVEPMSVEGRTLYRVRLGPFATQTEGERVRDTLRATMGLDASVIGR